MKNIWTGKRKKRNLSAAISAAASLAALLLVYMAVQRSDSDGYTAGRIRSGIINAAALCYSAEGSYPEDLKYLEDNYGIIVNNDKYIVHYSYSGGNVPPYVTVTRRES